MELGQSTAAPDSRGITMACALGKRGTAVAEGAYLVADGGDCHTKTPPPAKPGRLLITQVRVLAKLNAQTIGLITHFAKAYPKRSAYIVGLLFLSGFAEGVGIVTLLPVLELAIAEPDAADSRVLLIARHTLALVGLEPTLGVLLTLIVVGMSLKGAFFWLAFRSVGYTVANVATDLRLGLIQALLSARWGYFLGQKAGHLSNAVGTEAHRASHAYSNACYLVANIIQVLVYIVLAFLISPMVAVAAIVAGAVIALAFSRLVVMSREAGKDQTELIKSLSGRLVDALHALKPIKAMAQEAHLRPVLERETRELNRAQRREVIATSTMFAFREPLLVAILAVGLYFVLTFTAVTFASLIVMVFLFHRLVSKINSLQSYWKSVAVGESAFWSMQKSVELAKRQAENDGIGKPSPGLEHGIELRDVTFAYDNEPLLRSLSLEVPAGRFVAIVGPSGVGKTTMVDLMIGLYHPQAGDVLVDGISLREINWVDWRRKIGYVPQEMLLFHDTLLQNLTLGDQTIDRAAAEVALRKAGAWDFVLALPEGLDTTLGAQGARLSGGQRQRVAIARALVRKPKLLILDEVTTALDPRTEAEICKTLAQLKGEVTIVAISHQPAITRVADMTYTVANGGVTVTPAPSLAASG
jgi:ATP-binding cassette, subfamily C, bacterial